MKLCDLLCISHNLFHCCCEYWIFEDAFHAILLCVCVILLFCCCECCLKEEFLKISVRWCLVGILLVFAFGS